MGHKGGKSLDFQSRRREEGGGRREGMGSEGWGEREERGEREVRER